MILQSLKSRAFAKHAFLSGALASVALVCALFAGAETADGEITDQVSAVVTPAPESSLAAEQPQPAPATPAPEPVDVEEVTNAASSTQIAAESAPAVPAPSNPPASIRPSNGAGSRSSVVTDSAPPVSVPTGTETIASPAKRQVSGVAGNAGQDPAKTIVAAIDRSSPAVQIPSSSRLTDGILPLVPSGAERLLDPATLEWALPIPSLGTLERGLLTSALESTAPAAVGTLPSPTGTAPEPFPGTASEKAGGFAEHSFAGLFAHQPSLFPGGPLIRYSVDVGSMRLEATNSGGIRDKTTQFPTTDRVDGGYLGTTANHLSNPSPAPSRLPLPAPESPGGIETGSGGSFFVPLVALLALLALVAPATFRRRLADADFPPPTLFVCALERPG
jgi:hypothetical protein